MHNAAASLLIAKLHERTSTVHGIGLNPTCPYKKTYCLPPSGHSDKCTCPSQVRREVVRVLLPHGALRRYVVRCGGMWRVGEGCHGFLGVVQGDRTVWRVVEGLFRLLGVLQTCSGAFSALALAERRGKSNLFSLSACPSTIHAALVRHGWQPQPPSPSLAALQPQSNVTDGLSPEPFSLCRRTAFPRSTRPGTAPAHTHSRAAVAGSQNAEVHVAADKTSADLQVGPDLLECLLCPVRDSKTFNFGRGGSCTGRP